MNSELQDESLVLCRIYSLSIVSSGKRKRNRGREGGVFLQHGDNVAGGQSREPIKNRWKTCYGGRVTSATGSLTSGHIAHSLPCSGMSSVARSSAPHRYLHFQPLGECFVFQLPILHVEGIKLIKVTPQQSLLDIYIPRGERKLGQGFGNQCRRFPLPILLVVVTRAAICI